MESYGIKGNLISSVIWVYRAAAPFLVMMVFIGIILNSCAGGSELHLDMALNGDLTWEDTSDTKSGEKDLAGADSEGFVEKNVSPRVERLIVTLHIGEKNRLIEQAPFKLVIKPVNSKIVNLAETSFTRPARKFIVPVLLQEGETMLRVDARVYYCGKEDNAQCFIKKIETTVPVKISPGGSDVFRLELDCR